MNAKARKWLNKKRGKAMIRKKMIKEVNVTTNTNEIEEKVTELSELIKKFNSITEELAEVGLKIELEIK